MIELKNILVSGSTGKQGGALIRALLANNNPVQYHIFALSRDIKSSKSQHLAAQPNVTVIQGNWNDLPAVFSQLPKSLYGVFSVQTPMNNIKEEAQGKALVDAAAAHGVQHFVYASVERGGPEVSDVTPTHILHFISKYNIEKHLIKIAEANAFQYTIIRPVAFMDNFTNDFPGRGISTMFRLIGTDVKTQHVAAIDIGKLAAVVFQNPSTYSGRALSLASESLSWNDQNAIFKNVTGNEIPRTYDFVGRLIHYLASDLVGKMFDWFRDDGFGADVNEFRDVVPDMMGFEQWLRTESDWKAVKKTF